MNILNYTGSTVNIDGGESYPTVGLAYLPFSMETVGEVGGIPVTTKVFGKPVGLPEPQEGAILIVRENLVRALPERSDLYYRNEPITNCFGEIVRWKSIAR